ncbi:hypothetical protein Hanom_Chr08g00697121 [Helianthus anomalus]
MLNTGQGILVPPQSARIGKTMHLEESRKVYLHQFKFQLLLQNVNQLTNSKY